MFNPADAPAARGWSKRQANAQARLAKRDHQNSLAAVRRRYFAAVAAGFPTIEEHEAHLAAIAAPKPAEMPVTAPAEPVEPDQAVPVTDEPSEKEAAPEAPEQAPQTPKKPAKRKAQEG